MIRKISAGMIFPVSGVPFRKTIVFLNNDGEIIAVKESRDIDNIERLEFYDGILVPGFIPDNMHAVGRRWDDYTSYRGNNIFKEYSLMAQAVLNDIKRQQSFVSFQKLLETVTLEPAIELNLDRILGSIEAGKKPGLIQISNFDYKRLKVTAESHCKILTLPYFGDDENL